jgi:chromosome segregation ATPase
LAEEEKLAKAAGREAELNHELKSYKVQLAEAREAAAKDHEAAEEARRNLTSAEERAREEAAQKYAELEQQLGAMRQELEAAKHAGAKDRAAASEAAKKMADLQTRLNDMEDHDAKLESELKSVQGQLTKERQTVAQQREVAQQANKKLSETKTKVRARASKSVRADRPRPLIAARALDSRLPSLLMPPSGRRRASGSCNRCKSRWTQQRPRVLKTGTLQQSRR